MVCVISSRLSTKSSPRQHLRSAYTVLRRWTEQALPTALPPKPQAPGPEDCCQVLMTVPFTTHASYFRAQVTIITAKLLEAEPEALLAQSGCTECVWEVYQRDLLAYQRAVARQAGAPEPIDPFEALERQLYGQANDRSGEPS